MDFFDVIRGRRSIRKYKADLPVPLDAIEQILDAARFAPSWHNNQTSRFLVVSDPAQKEALIEAVSDENPCKKGLRQAPVVIVACGSPDESGQKDGKQYYLTDVGIALEHVCLAARVFGLGTCWIGVVDEGIVRRVLGVPESVRVVAVTPLGYPEFEPKPRPRKELSEIAFGGQWGTPFIPA